MITMYQKGLSDFCRLVKNTTQRQPFDITEPATTYNVMPTKQPTSKFPTLYMKIHEIG